MTRCREHRRETEGPCNWCGDKLCSECIAQNSRNLIYCEKCSLKVRVRAKVPAAKKPAPEMYLHESPKKPTLTHDGYLDLT